MLLDLSNRQIAHELCGSAVQAMTEVLRQGIVAKTPEVVLSGGVEFDEVHDVARHKANPDTVLAKGRKGRCNRLKGIRSRGTLQHIFDMIQRGGQVVIWMLEMSSKYRSCG